MRTGEVRRGMVPGMVKCLTVRQPWAWLIVAGIKPVENRSWRHPYLGRLLIHAARTYDHEGHNWVVSRFPEIEFRAEHLPLGFIVGDAEVIGCVDLHYSPWFAGPHAFVFDMEFKRARELATPVPMKGKLGLYDVAESLIEGAEWKPRREW